MTYYDKIYDYAVDNYYYITSEEANSLNIPRVELVKLSKRGKLDHCAYGVYRLSKYIPSELDKFALSLKLVGKDAFIYGESVLALLELCPTNPKNIYVGTYKRVRKKLPNNIKLLRFKRKKNTDLYESIKIQQIENAILSAKDYIIPEKLLVAIDNAKLKGYITNNIANKLKKECSEKN